MDFDDFDRDGHNSTVYLSRAEMKYFESREYLYEEDEEQEDEDDEVC